MVHWLRVFIMSRTHLEITYTLWLAECQGTPCSKQAWYLTTSDCNVTQTHKNLVRKRTLNQLAQLAKWLCSFVSTSLYGAVTVYFDHVTYAFSVKLLWLPESQGTPSSKQARRESIFPVTRDSFVSFATLLKRVSDTGVFQMFPCKIYKNIFYRTPPVADSVLPSEFLQLFPITSNFLLPCHLSFKIK